MIIRLLLFPLVLLAAVIGCARHPVLVISEFSSDPVVITNEVKLDNVVGLKLKARGSLSEPIEMHVGLKGKIHKSVKLSSNALYDGRFDWYDAEAEISFSTSSDVFGEIELEYQFLTL